MSRCKKQSGGIHIQLKEKIEKYLDKLRFGYPGTKFSLVLGPDGEIVAQKVTDDSDMQEEVAQLLPPLLKAAEQFGAAKVIGQHTCQVMHILGSKYIFSCFIIDESASKLLFFSEMSHHAIMQHNTVAADEQVVEEVILPLKRELENLIIKDAE